MKKTICSIVLLASMNALLCGCQITVCIKSDCYQFPAAEADMQEAEAPDEHSLNVIKALLHDNRDSDKAVDTLLQPRADLIKELMEIISPANKDQYAYAARAAAAYTLGEHRATEAAPWLLLLVEEEFQAKEWNRYTLGPHKALVKLGRAAVPTYLKTIKGSDNRFLVKLSIDLLAQAIGGKGHLIALLYRLEREDAVTNKRIEKAINYAIYGYKELKVPLY